MACMMRHMELVELLRISVRDYEADCAKIVLVHAPDGLLHIEHGALLVASMLI